MMRRVRIKSANTGLYLTVALGNRLILMPEGELANIWSLQVLDHIDKACAIMSIGPGKYLHCEPDKKSLHLNLANPAILANNPVSSSGAFLQMLSVKKKEEYDIQYIPIGKPASVSRLTHCNTPPYNVFFKLATDNTPEDHWIFEKAKY